MNNFLRVSVLPKLIYFWRVLQKVSSSSSKLLCLISLLLYLILVNVCVVAKYLLVVIVGKHLLTPYRCCLGVVRWISERKLENSHIWKHYIHKWMEYKKIIMETLTKKTSGLPFHSLLFFHKSNHSSKLDNLSVHIWA
jgi:hypothetical protein